MNSTRATVAIALLSITSAAAAHDFWLQPRSFRTAPNAMLPVNVLIGHGADRQRWGGEASRVLLLKSFGPAGSVDHRPRFRPAGGAVDLAPAFGSPGLHILAMRTDHAVSVLPPQRFNDYLREEGLTPILAARQRRGEGKTPGREIYSRRAKALIVVGAATSRPDPLAIRAIGLDLEIVPERDPYALGSSRILPIHVLHRGRRLPGALVKLTDLARDERPVAVVRTDRAGRAIFRVPARGAWLLNVVWSEPVTKDPRADFDTIFSSLTFGYDRP